MGSLVNKEVNKQLSLSLAVPNTHLVSNTASPKHNELELELALGLGYLRSSFSSNSCSSFLFFSLRVRLV